MVPLVKLIAAPEPHWGALVTTEGVLDRDAPGQYWLYYSHDTALNGATSASIAVIPKRGVEFPESLVGKWVGLRGVFLPAPHSLWGNGRVVEVDRMFPGGTTLDDGDRIGFPPEKTLLDALGITAPEPAQSP